MPKQFLTATFALWVIILGLVQPLKSAQAGELGAGSDYWAWTTETWSGSDKPFVTIRSDIWQKIAAGQSPLTLAAQYKIKAKTVPYHPPYDAATQYRWAYAAYQAALKDARYRNSSEFVQASQSLGYGPSPQSYEYARLRFLMSAMNWPDEHLKALGKRLLQRNPTNYQVKYELVDVLDGTGSAAELRQALSYVNDLMRSSPNKPSIISSLAWTYYVMWLQDKQKVHADKAVAAYQHYLSLVPPDDASRSSVEQQIQRIQARTP